MQPALVNYKLHWMLPWGDPPLLEGVGRLWTPSAITEQVTRVVLLFSLASQLLKGAPGAEGWEERKEREGEVEGVGGGGAEWSYAHSFSQLKTDPTAGNVRGLEQAPNG